MKELYASLLSSTDLDNEKGLLSRGWEDSILWQVEESDMSHRNCDQFSPGEASSSRSDPSFTSPAYHWLHLIIIPRAQAREWSRAGAGRRWVLDIRIDILFQLQWFQMWQGSKPTDLQGTVGGRWHESERNAGLVVLLCEEKSVLHSCQFSNGISGAELRNIQSKKTDWAPTLFWIP